ncbi:MAG: hypothetical protein ACM34L_03785, partial [Gemmatimonas sp.]
FIRYHIIICAQLSSLPVDAYVGNGTNAGSMRTPRSGAVLESAMELKAVLVARFLNDEVPYVHA